MSGHYVNEKGQSKYDPYIDENGVRRRFMFDYTISEKLHILNCRLKCFWKLSKVRKLIFFTKDYLFLSVYFIFCMLSSFSSGYETSLNKFKKYRCYIFSVRDCNYHFDLLECQSLQKRIHVLTKEIIAAYRVYYK